MNASFGCKGEIHLEVVEMFPSRRGSLSLGSKETSPSLSEFAGAFLVIAFPVAQEDGEAVGARVFQHLVAAAVLCCHAQRVQNLCFDGGEHDGEFGWGVADDDISSELHPLRPWSGRRRQTGRRLSLWHCCN